ncbi:AMMECR1 domain-containing protein, partial [Patescibacteria group bacterium]
MKNSYISLAKSAIETFVKTGKTISLPSNLPKKMLTTKAGVFVSIHTKNKKLRGC